MKQANKLKHEQLVGELAAFLVSRPAHGQAAEVRSTRGPTYVHQPRVYGAVSRWGQHSCS